MLTKLAEGPRSSSSRSSPSPTAATWRRPSPRRAGSVCSASPAHSPKGLQAELEWIEKEVDGKPYGVDLLLPSKFVGQRQGRPRQADQLDELHSRRSTYAFLDQLLERPRRSGAARRTPRCGNEFSVGYEQQREVIELVFQHPISADRFRARSAALVDDRAWAARTGREGGRARGHRGAREAPRGGGRRHRRRPGLRGGRPHRHDLHDGARTRGRRRGEPGSGGGRWRHRQWPSGHRGARTRRTRRVVWIGVAHHGGSGDTSGREREVS